jgi:hypothetical protein
MPKTEKSTRPSKAATAIVMLGLAAILVSGCGGSSKSSSASTSSPAKATSRGGSSANRLAAMRACLQQHGVAPSKGAGEGLPKAVTQAQYQAAVKKCGGLLGGGFANTPRFNSPQFKRALAIFAACLRQHGVKAPASSSTANGPVFDAAHVNTASAQFKAAQSKCSVQLRGALRRPGGGVAP